MNIDSAIWGLTGTVIGALASIGTTWLSVWTTGKREEESARSHRMESAREFQRKTSIELQEAIHLHARNSALVLLEVRRRKKANAEGLKNEDHSDLMQEEMRQSGLAISILRERILNETIRDLVAKFQKQCVEFSLGEDSEDIQDARMEFTLNFNTVVRELGIFHRALFEFFVDSYKRAK